MADRIFPNTSTETSNPKTLNLIDTHQLISAINNKVASPVNAGNIMVNTANNKSEEVEPAITIKNSGNVPPQLRDHVFKSKNKKDESKEEEKDNDKKDEKKTKKEKVEVDVEVKDEDGIEDNKMTKKGKEKMAQSRTRKIHFSSPDQISAEAVQAAKDNGDEELYNVILAARQERRVAMAKTLETTLKNSELQQKLASRNQYRMDIVAKAENSEKNINVANNKVTQEKTAFKKVDSLSNVEKQTFAQIAASFGFPSTYTESILAEKPVSDNLEDIKSVMASNIPLNIKKTVLSSMIKESNVHTDNVDRLKHYWIDELGYNDPEAKEWVDEWLDDNTSEKTTKEAKKK